MRSRRVMLAAATITVACGMPTFLTGALAVQIIDELGIGRATLGLAVGTHIAAQSLLSAVFGRVVDRIGAPQSLRAAALGGAAACAAIAAFVHSGRALIIALAFAGAAYSIATPAASAMIGGSVEQRRQGLAFGLFQAAKPAATLLGGLSVPFIALPFGWRWVYAVAAVGGVLSALTVHSSARTRKKAVAPADRHRIPLRLLAVLLVSTSLAFGSATMISTFLVDSGVDAGLTPGHAGLLLSVASAIAITSRVIAGILADRRDGRHLLIVCLMMAGGAGGLALLAADVPLFLAGAVVASALGWGYNGLFYMSMARLRPDAPGAMTGLVMSGGSIGGFVAPVLFGIVVERFSYTAAWAMGAGWLLTGSVLLWWSRALIIADRRRHAESAAAAAGPDDS